MRVQLALNVKDLEAAIDFYGRMFGVPLNKRREGYANFVVENPPLKLVLFENPEAAEHLNHVGVEVEGDSEVQQVTERFLEAGLAAQIEGEGTCCYAKQDKVWVNGPHGHSWEWYKVLDDSQTFWDAGEGADAGNGAGEGPTDTAAMPQGAVSRIPSPDSTDPAAGGGCCT